uniref:Putative ovule protein n=1 Tax=Solanum chacoense TaxID=4108 RepID=A0A0V0HPH4_SOLCH
MHEESLRQHLSAPISQTSLYFIQAFITNCSSLQNCNFEHITSLDRNLPLSKKHTHKHFRCC